MNEIPESIWQYLSIGAVGLLVTIVGTYARNTRNDLKELRHDHQKLNDFVLREFHPKSEVNAALAAIKMSFDKFIERYDQDMREIRSLMVGIRTVDKGK